MANLAEDLDGACNFCERACQNRRYFWYCDARQDDFPDAEWSDEKEDESECRYFEYNGGYRNT